MLFILALFAVLSAGCLSAQTADLVIENATIHTGLTTQPQASFLAIKGSRILYVGDPKPDLIGTSTRRLNLQGAAVFPGFIDSHVHLAGLGEMLDSLNLRGLDSIERVASLVRQAAANRPAGEWIRGRAWDQTNWGGQFPTAEAISAAAPKHPTYLTRVDGHAAWANRAAMELAGITRDTADPPGGKVIRDAKGNPTGVFIDRAMGLLTTRIPARTPDQVERYLRAGALECARLGLTGVHDAGVSSEEISAYRRLIARKQLPVRVYAMIRGAGELWREYLERGPEIGDHLTVRSIKLVADGAMGSRGAALHAPYSDDGDNRGLLMLTKEQIEQVAREAVRRGFQVNTHAIGDRANSITLDAYAAALGGPNDQRFRIEHAQIVRPSDFGLFRKLSVIASIQSTHATSDMRWANVRLGPNRIDGAWAAKTFLINNVRIANGSDFPVEEADPLLGFYAAVTRTDHKGQPSGGFRPEEKLSRYEALKSWTLDGAFAAFEETFKGTLESGKLADVVVLSANILSVPPQEILNARVLYTILGGEIVYARPGGQNTR
ncbi:MAG TPA: amidohydrolase [Bryobacteraceae bacterium]|nr:amidohydrolase [Bryobacteraceae bacterium]